MTPALSRSIGGPLTIKLDSFPLEGRLADVTLAIYDRRHTTPVKSGENQGRKVVYANVVQTLKPIGEWGGAAETLRIPRAQLPRDGYDFCAVLMQQGASGPILAAAEIKMN